MFILKMKIHEIEHFSSELAIVLLENGARLGLENKYGETPLEKARRALATELEARAQQMDEE